MKHFGSLEYLQGHETNSRFSDSILCRIFREKHFKFSIRSDEEMESNKEVNYKTWKHSLKKA